ncbi:AraC family transcriptional regulator [Bacillus sp. FJAT-27225]|uniref:helix-turn-helix domain-containing protein n=1 Tax=Bacillus sp. FJAT-27225 TaxID=1743144 RepID=UPI00080C3174|nr:helix-turn-helix domain-containing protein [Bacillus sp. FJAT-27225]OCA83246.1 AraC family transcriptional regulator [Bacillus sp. FJAT-27225]
MAKQDDSYIKICTILHAVTKIDSRLIDINGQPSFQLVNHPTPAVLQNLENEFLIINNALQQNGQDAIYYYVNPYGLEFLAAGLWDSSCSLEASIVIGPFLSNTSVIEFMNDMIVNHKLPVSGRTQLQSFYKSLPVVTYQENEAIGEMIATMCHGGLIHPKIVTSAPRIPLINKEKLNESLAESKSVIENRYEYEKKLMNAIAKGDTSVVGKISKLSVDVLDFSNRIPESPIRSAKNISLVSNTICRIAAEKGGVHPVYLHTISEKFAILIERAPSLNHLKKLGAIMVKEYCETVKEFSTRNYSPIIKQVVDYIHFNLQNPLTLNEIALEMRVNPSYLSRKFKEETNKTLTDYINHKRIEEAKVYFYRGNKTVTEIAFLVGFNDVNYFSRVFKKLTTLTPSQYLKNQYTIQNSE